MHKFPFAGAIKTTTLNFVASTRSYALPADFVLDVRNGIILADDKGRLRRWGLNRLLKYPRASTSNGQPRRYVILTPNVEVYPAPDKAYTGTLYYYSLPAALGATTIPNFPSDWILVEYVVLRGREWLQQVPPGTALGFAAKFTADLQKSGIGNEAEDDEMDIDEERWASGLEAADPNRWMGTPAL